MRSWALSAFTILASAVLAVSCSTPADTLEFQNHPDGWNDAASENFHGIFVIEGAEEFANCTSCHGADLTGNPSKAPTSCFECHSSFPHPDGFAMPSSENFHAEFIAEDLHWQIGFCANCHGSDFAGEGFPAKNCLTCHTEPDGPIACNTCHGSETSAAPPEDLAGNTDVSFPSVGAHQVHTGGSLIAGATAFDCGNCHADIEAYEHPEHLDGGPAMAEVVFSALSTMNGSLATTYDPASNTCSNVYCHGDFTFLRSESETPGVYTADAMTGADLVLDWTEPGMGATTCGSCHGLPPIGHVRNMSCATCHFTVVDADRNIIDPSKHINGEIDVF